jgi:hypothetical protein
MRPLYYLLDEHHEPVPLPESDADGWSLRYANSDRYVAVDSVGDATLSTIFLGVDHNHLGAGPPLLFETALFGPDDQVEVVARYSTWNEAEQGHQRAVGERIFPRPLLRPRRP